MTPARAEAIRRSRDLIRVENDRLAELALDDEPDLIAAHVVIATAIADVTDVILRAEQRRDQKFGRLGS